MAEPLKSDFGIEVKFTPGTPDPARVFRSMTALIDSFQRFDKELVQTIDSTIEPVLLLEDIDAGSLRTWLRSVITSVDDSALQSGDWKKIVGNYLLKSKYIIVRRLEGKTHITTRDQIKEIEAELLTAAEDTKIKRIPSYRPVPESKIIEVIENFGNALAHLAPNDSAKLMAPDGEANFNLTLKMAPDSLRALLVKESVTNDPTMILKVKRPDYLGEAMWDFKFGDHPLQAKIVDFKWLGDFQGRKVDVRPGDAIRAKVRHTINYGHDAEIVSEHYEVAEVLEVIALILPHQPPLLEG
jgi:hypothetical protein